MTSHLRATRRHLPYGITQYYLPPEASELAPPNPSQTEIVVHPCSSVFVLVCPSLSQFIDEAKSALSVTKIALLCDQLEGLIAVAPNA